MVKKSYIIAGPTASGKSDFAHRLAKRLGGTIINADSVQIYRGIKSLSASPFADLPTMSDSIDGVPYRLFGICDLSDQMNVADYLDRARAEYDAADIPIFVGGSGYYINAIINGMSPIPNISDENRKKARRMVAETPDAALSITDFEFNDPQRMDRALEVLLETGRPISEWQQLPRRGAIKPTPYRVLISPHRDILIDRIRARLPIMLDQGGLDEARENINYSDRAIGIDELGRFIRGESAMDQILESWTLRTCQYAKRQTTWFRNQYVPDIIIPRVPTKEDLERVICEM